MISWDMEFKKIQTTDQRKQLEMVDGDGSPHSCWGLVAPTRTGHRPPVPQHPASPKPGPSSFIASDPIK